MVPFVFYEGPPYYLSKVGWLFIHLVIHPSHLSNHPSTHPSYFHSHHSKGTTGPLNSISRATSPNHEISGMPFPPFKVSTLFPQAASGSPRGSVIVSSQTHPRSQQEVPDAPFPACSDLPL
uniref:Uncharacterized protein n=1 Tax=Rousettus aegyptiacus TaxID=9407 RepID=A0A7J8E8S8_ROUAE|nr:hypothetical protein HJG63_008227 [Rousettus aegyptiacus]